MGKTSSSGEPRLGYRPGLDGLRALAVAAVFLYHASGMPLPGGFLGVDLFFVLSGYLITSLLLVEWERAGRLDLRRFWLRRARRLLPAVVVLVAVTTLVTAFVARDVLARTREDALSSLLYVTNWRLIIESHSYFASVGRPSPLLHLWSLAVEEQFYLLWPLLLGAGLLFLRRRTLVPLVLAGALGSTALMWLLYDPERDPSRVYYGTDTRAATLLVGALLALVWPAARARVAARRAPLALEVVGVAALAGLAWAFWRLPDYDPRLYRGGFLAVAVCAAALIGVVAHPGSRLGWLLGRQPLRWLGIRSYGIYLWHWPVLALTRPGVDVPWRGPGVVAAQAALTVALAALSFWLVERPIRSGELQRRLALRPRPQRLALGLGLVGSVGAAATLVIALPAVPAPAASASAPPAPPLSIPIEFRLPPTHPANHPPRSVAPPPRSLGRVLAVGDSVMLGCSPELRELIGGRLKVDAVVGRQIVDTVADLRTYRKRGRLPKTVVVQVGDNGPAWYHDLVDLRHALGGVHSVVLVNVRVDRSWQGQVNRELDTFARSWRQATVADWFGHSSDRILSDGVHPTPDACRTYASVIAGALRASH